MTPPRVQIGTLAIDTVTFDGALRQLEQLVHAGRGGAVFTPNVDHVMIAERDALLREVYAHADLALADGMPILWASRLIGPRIPEKVSGSDLMLPLLKLAAARRWRVYLLGGADRVAYQAADVLRETLGVNVVGVDDSRIELAASAGEQEITQRIIAAQPHLLLVALGCPKQERYIHRVRDSLGATVSIGIGASLDFITGRVSRAPVWMQRSGLEWSYRLLQEPGRLWKRYLVQDTQFLLVVLRTLLRRS
jgi:N-acetylglucosaminyldiphosphoundecaprenol N-acetyl-beta-D-mannosaminyltransferase